MNRMVRAIIAIALIAIITVAAVAVTHSIGRSLRLDITDQKLYTLSEGSKAIVGSLNQPVKIKLFYTKTAAMKGPDNIRFFNNYYVYVRAILDEYIRAAKGNIQLEVIDPRPFSDEEEAAIRHGLKRFRLSEEENFFFGMVLETPFGVEKKIEFFSPDRQNFIEYDISYLIDTAMTRDKKRLGIISSIQVMGDVGYMAQMMAAQGRQPRKPWGLVRHLQQTYQVNQLETEIDEIKDTDILLVIHPKDLSEKTRFAIDQYVLKGGRTIVFLDPYAVVDQADPMMMRSGQMPTSSSSLPGLLKAWGLEMPQGTFAGDLSLPAPGGASQVMIAIMSLGRNNKNFNPDSVITANLNQVNVFFPGVLIETAEVPEGVTLTPLLMTSERGNSWQASSFELMRPNFEELTKKFTPGDKPVVMGYQVTGKLKSAFPDGIEVPDESADTPADENGKIEDKTKTVTGLTEATEDCAVVVFADVDFITDTVAYRTNIFGISIVGDNAALVLNSIEDLSGSSNLISIRSRGNFKRPFTAVDKIEQEAQAETAVEEKNINTEIVGFQNKLNQILSTANVDDGKIIETKILNEKRDVELKIHDLQKKLRKVNMKKVQRIEKLGIRLRNLCTLPGPAIILLIAIILGVRKSVMKRHYISHASDS